jgi:hypothetical protein
MIVVKRLVFELVVPILLWLCVFAAVARAHEAPGINPSAPIDPRFIKAKPTVSKLYERIVLCEKRLWVMEQKIEAMDGVVRKEVGKNLQIQARQKRVE